MDKRTNNQPLLHIFLVNFHHKKGSQIEFVHPPFEFPGSTGSVESVPSCWKYLPTFCLPDGAHNVSKDTVFFTLPDMLNPKSSIFGVSCYRQVAVEDLKVVSEDVTRSSVQKSVCALLSRPFFSYIEVKLGLIADLIADTGFAKTDILIQAYAQINDCILNINIDSPLHQMHTGLNLRDLFLKWRHKLLILFKLFLLQKRVIFFGSPVRPTCATIIGIVSLYPELMTSGFDEVFCVQTSRPISPMPTFTNSSPKSNDTEKTILDFDESSESQRKPSLCNITSKDDTSSEKTTTEPQRENSMDALYSCMSPYCSIKPHKWSAPIPIFQNGNLLCPYLSLPYMDLLQDPSVKSYVIGASNILFKQKRQLADVFVETETGKIELNDPNVGDLELRKLLELSTEDRRFIDYLLKHVQNPKEGAEGSEHWIREQFYGYTVALLRTSLCTGGSKELDQFNGHFMTIFRRTDAYDDWSSARVDSDEFKALPPGHPFSGNLSVVDMKLRIAQSMHNSESGRKINQAVNQTTKVVGGAISTAKSTFTSWWSSITTTTTTGDATIENSDLKMTRTTISDEEIEKNIPKNDQVESCVEALPEDASIPTNDSDKTRRRKESTKEELEEIIQKTADKILEYAKEVDPDFENCKKGKVFTV